jgi:hypothetical protein
MSVVTGSALPRALPLLLALLLAAAAVVVMPAAPVAGQIPITDCSPANVPTIVGQLQAGGHYVFGGACPTTTIDLNAPIEIADGVTTRIDGNGVTFRNAVGIHAGGRVFRIFETGDLMLDRVTITGSGNGGGIHNRGALTITNSTFRDNVTAGGGGAILNSSSINSATLVIAGTTFNNNTAISNGGAIYNVVSGGPGMGTVTIVGSTFSNNTASTIGGAIYNASLGNSTAAVTIANSTFNANTANLSGGAIVNEVVVGTGTITLASTIFAASSSAHCLNDGGVITSTGYNLADATDASCFSGAVTGDQLVLDAQLGPLADNGGPTRTHLPAPTSAAIDQGNCPGLSTDQRGLPRVVDLAPSNAADGCDVGSVEHQGIATDSFDLRTNELEPYPDSVRQQAGDPIYVKFSLGSNLGMDILASALVQQIGCATGAPIGDPQPAQTIGALRYFAGAGYYQLIWRTQINWANTCRQLILRFSDGSEVRFNVEFTRNR